MRIYKGTRTEEGCKVEVIDSEGTFEPYPLTGCQHIRNHSPTGFEWGYGGSGPAQLALAILHDVYHNVRLAELGYQRFKWACIAHMPKPGWELSEDDILAIMKAMVPNGNP